MLITPVASSMKKDNDDGGGFTIANHATVEMKWVSVKVALTVSNGRRVMTQDNEQRHFII